MPVFTRTSPVLAPQRHNETTPRDVPGALLWFSWFVTRSCEYAGSPWTNQKADNDEDDTPKNLSAKKGDDPADNQDDGENPKDYCHGVLHSPVHRVCVRPDYCSWERTPTPSTKWSYSQETPRNGSRDARKAKKGSMKTVEEIDEWITDLKGDVRDAATWQQAIGAKAAIKALKWAKKTNDPFQIQVQLNTALVEKGKSLGNDPAGVSAASVVETLKWVLDQPSDS